MKVLLTGYSGQLGQELFKLFSPRDEVVTAGRSKCNDIRCDLSDYAAAKYGEISKNKYDIIIHAASAQNSESLCYQNNLFMTRNLIEHLKHPQLFVFISTLGVYGKNYDVKNKQSPYRELDCRGENNYVQSKLACEHLVKTHIDNCAIFRPCGIISANSKHGLVGDIYKKLHSESPALELFGSSPGISKPYILASDAAKQIYNTVERIISSNINTYAVEDVCSTSSITVKEVAEIMMECTNIHKPIIWTDSPNVGDSSSKSAIEKYCIEMSKIK